MGSSLQDEDSILESGSAKAREDSPAHSDESSDTTRSASQVPSSITDGKRRSYTPWLQAFGSFILFCNTWYAKRYYNAAVSEVQTTDWCRGIILAFGVFQTYYEQQLLKKTSSSTISWIGTTSAFLLLLGGVFSGKVYDLGYSRELLVAGSFLVVFGLFMTSLSTEFYQVFLAQGVAVGLGTSMLWIPAITVVAAGFKDRMRSIMLGVVSTGSSIGGVIYPIMFNRLLAPVGFPWTVRIMAFIILGTFILALATLLPPKPPKSSSARRLFDKTALTDVPYMVFTTASVFTLLGYFTPFVYLPSFVSSSVHGLPNPDLAFYSLAIANGASSISRIGGGFIANKIGPGATYIAALSLSSVLLFVWIAVDTVAGLVVWAILWGFSTGVIISLRGALVPQLCPRVDLLGSRLGMSFIGSAFGVLIGAPIGGKLIYAISPSKPTWWPLQVFTGLAMLIGAVMNLYPCLHIQARARERQKAQRLSGERNAGKE